MGPRRKICTHCAFCCESIASLATDIESRDSARTAPTSAAESFASVRVWRAVARKICASTFGRSQPMWDGVCTFTTRESCPSSHRRLGTRVSARWRPGELSSGGVVRTRARGARAERNARESRSHTTSAFGAFSDSSEPPGVGSSCSEAGDVNKMGLRRGKQQQPLFVAHRAC